MVLVGIFVLAPLARVHLDALVDAIPPPDPTAGAASVASKVSISASPSWMTSSKWDISVDAAVIYAAVSSMTADNWRPFYRRSEDRSWISPPERGRKGCRPTRPNSGARPSPRPYLDRITSLSLYITAGETTSPELRRFRHVDCDQP